MKVQESERVRTYYRLYEFNWPESAADVRQFIRGGIHSHPRILNLIGIEWWKPEATTTLRFC
jgi:hypothetical protein